MTKSAAVKNCAEEKGSVEIREINQPEIGEGEVLLEVANVGVCGSDLHQWTSDHSWPVNYPVVWGINLGTKLNGAEVVVLGLESDTGRLEIARHGGIRSIRRKTNNRRFLTGNILAGNFPENALW